MTSPPIETPGADAAATAAAPAAATSLADEKRQRTGLIALALFVLALIATYTAQDIWREEDDVRRGVEQDLHTYTLALAEHTALTVRSIDHVLRLAIAELDPADRDRPFFAGRVHARFRRLLESAPFSANLAYADESGRLRAHTLVAAPGSVSLADRSHFKVHQERTDAGLYVSETFVPRLGDPERRVAFSRRVDGPAGEFFGIVALSLRVGDLTRFFQSTSAYPGGATALFRTDGTLIARFPPVEGMYNRHYGDIPLFRDLAPKNPTGVFRTSGRVDAQTRTLAYRVIDSAPLLVNASVAEDEFLAPWRRYAWRGGIAGATVLVFVAVLFAVALRQQAANARQSRALARNEALLEARVRERTAQLQAAVDDLARARDEIVRREKLAALGTLVAGVAHELNTPIGNCVTVATTLNDHYLEFEKAVHAGAIRRSAMQHFVGAAKTGVDQLIRNLARAHELIASFKQVAIDQTSEQKRSFDLRDTLDEIAATLGPMIRPGGHRLDIAVAAGWRMNSFPGPLAQVVTNLVSNAIAHGFDGRTGGVMTLSTAPAAEGRVCLVFSDDGGGIAEQHLGRIYDPFFTTRLGQGGSGLGLHIVHNLVTGVLGGDIRVDSREGHGTTFMLDLPLDVAPKSV